MGMFDGCKPEPIRKSVVEKPGDYWLRILDVQTGNSPRDGAFYIRVTCGVIGYTGVNASVFLTQGLSWNSQLTAFFDTFGIRRFEENFSAWKGSVGKMHIELSQKDGYTNMKPTFILDDAGYAHHETYNDNLPDPGNHIKPKFPTEYMSFPQQIEDTTVYVNPDTSREWSL